jgi:hypothetical protein
MKDVEFHDFIKQEELDVKLGNIFQSIIEKDFGEWMK